MCLAACTNGTDDILPSADNKTLEVSADQNVVAAFTNGTYMTVSAISTEPASRGGGGVGVGGGGGGYNGGGYTPGVTQSELQAFALLIPDNIQRSWFCEADDFGIRLNGEYQTIDFADTITGIDFTVNRMQSDPFVLAESNLPLAGTGAPDNIKVAVYNLPNLNVGDEYTYETWLWANDDAVDLGTWQEDITEECAPVYAPTNDPEHFSIRYNVYKGVNNGGAVAYIKVSIHIVKTQEVPYPSLWDDINKVVGFGGGGGGGGY